MLSFICIYSRSVLYFSYGGVIMEKDKLINVIKSETKGLDERDNIINAKSFHWGYKGGLIFIAILMIIRLSVGEYFNLDLLMIIIGQMGISSFYSFTQNKENKADLYYSIVALIITFGLFYSTLAYYEIF